MSIERPLGDTSIKVMITGPPKSRPHKLSNCCVRVARFTHVEVAAVAEEVPFDGADDPGLAGLTVEFSKLIARGLSSMFWRFPPVPNSEMELLNRPVLVPAMP